LGRARRFTWWDIGVGYLRNLGMRIDLLASRHWPIASTPPGSTTPPAPTTGPPTKRP
jgi:hypothetical protein